MDTLPKPILHQGLLRWLHGIDLNSDSKSYGIADRDYWCWKTKDFPNGTLQAGLSAFLDTYELFNWESIIPAKDLIKAILKGCQTIQRHDGSFEEAYPRESSYAVTGLVQFNLLYCYNKHKRFYDPECVSLMENVCRSSNNFLEGTPETHGLISNHRATSELAIAFWKKYLDLPIESNFKFLGLQSVEGWFPEYDGADPGYQTLLNHYINAFFDSLPATNDDGFIDLKESLDFVRSFAYPDGNFAGEIGSRGTRIIYPSGFVMGSNSALNWFEKSHLTLCSAVNPTNVDSGNLVPVLNSWALQYEKNWEADSFDFAFTKSIEYPKAGLAVFRSQNNYISYNLHNGCTLSGEKKADEWFSKNIVGFRKGNLVTQLGEAQLLKNDANQLLLKLGAAMFTQSYNTPFRSIILRIVAPVLLIASPLQRLFKIILARFVLKSEKKSIATPIALTIDKENFRISVEGAEEWSRIDSGFYKHMASANTFYPKSNS